MADLNTFLTQNRGKQKELPPIDLRGAIAKTNEKQVTQGIEPYLTNAGNSFIRSAHQVAETPYNMINNAPRLANLIPGVDGVGKLSEMGVPGFKQLGEDPINDFVAKHYPGMSGVGGIDQPNPNYPISTNVAEGFGSGVAGLGLVKALAGAPGIVGKFAQYLNAPVQAAPKAAVVGELASAAGGETGRYVAEKNQWGPVASMAAQFLGSMGPAALTYAAPEAVGRLFRRADDLPAETFLGKFKGLVTPADDSASARSLEALQRQDIRPSVGLVGNRMGGQVEAGTSAMPGFSGVPENVRTQQFTEFEDALQKLGSEIRPENVARAPVLDDMARQVNDIADTGLTKITSGFSGREDDLAKAFTNNIDVTSTRNAIMEQMKTAGPKAQKVLQDELDSLGTMVDDAGKVPYQNFKNWRSEFGAGIEDKGIISGAKKQVYAGAVDDLQKAADLHGVGDEFKQLMSEQASAHSKSIVGGGGEIPALKNVVGAKDIGKSKTFFKDALTDPDKLSILKQSATPEQWAMFKGNVLEHLGLAKAGFQNEAGDALSPTQFAVAWGKLNPRVKNILFDDPAIKQTLDDIVTVSKDFQRRGLEANTSRTAGTGLTAQAVRQIGKELNPMGIAAGVGVGTAAHASLPATAAGLATTYGVVKALLSETLAKWAGGQTPTIQSTVGARVPGAAARSLSNEDDNGDHEFR